jgi:hypothetical protein
VGTTPPLEGHETPTDAQPPLQTVPNDPTDELAAIVSQWTPGTIPAVTPSEEGFQQALGRAILQILQETLHTQLAGMLEQLAPQILATVQEVVMAKTADLLEDLLQREIDKLKRALEDHEPDGE